MHSALLSDSVTLQAVGLVTLRVVQSYVVGRADCVAGCAGWLRLIFLSISVLRIWVCWVAMDFAYEINEFSYKPMCGLETVTFSYS